MNDSEKTESDDPIEQITESIQSTINKIQAYVKLYSAKTGVGAGLLTLIFIYPSKRELGQFTEAKKVLQSCLDVYNEKLDEYDINDFVTSVQEALKTALGSNVVVRWTLGLATRCREPVKDIKASREIAAVTVGNYKNLIKKLDETAQKLAEKDRTAEKYKTTIARMDETIDNQITKELELLAILGGTNSQAVDEYMNRHYPGNVDAAGPSNDLVPKDNHPVFRRGKRRANPTMDGYAAVPEEAVPEDVELEMRNPVSESNVGIRQRR